MAESRDVKRFKRFNNQLSKTNDLPIGDLEICSASAKTPITSTIKLASYNETYYIYHKSGKEAESGRGFLSVNQTAVNINIR